MRELFKNHLLIFIVFLVVGLGIYANSFDNEFFWDDDDSIVKNVYIKDWKYLPNFFTENLIAGAGQVTNYYRPILLISFALDHHLWGLDPLGFHFTNSLIHIFCAWLLFLIFNRLALGSGKGGISGFLAFSAALLFLIHPLQTEAVTYVAGRADPLSTLFSLLSIWFFIGFRSLPEGKKSRYFWCITFFILGILTKEQVIILPLLFMLIDMVFFIKKIDKKRVVGVLKRSLLPLSLSALYFVLHFTFLDFKGDTLFDYHNTVYDSSPLVRLFTFFFVILSYLKLLFVPTGLHMAREVEPVASFLSWPVALFLMLSAILIFVCFKTWKENKLITFGFLWFIIILLPRTNILSINRPMYEHWLYLPMAGFWLAFFSLISLLLGKVNKDKVKKTIASVLLIIFAIYSLQFAYLTVKRNNDWQDPITFYEKNLKYTPNSFIQRNNLGMAYAGVGEYEKAITEYEKAIEIKDIYPQVHHNMANVLVALGEYEKAITEYEKAIEMSPLFGVSYGNLYNLYISKGDKEKAEELREKFEKNFK